MINIVIVIIIVVVVVVVVVAFVLCLSQAELAKLQREVDAIIASECPLCGDIAINSICKPLVDMGTSIN